MLRRGDSGEPPRPATAWRAPIAGPACAVGLGHPATRLSPPPQIELLAEPSSAFDPSESEPVPDFEFEQSLPEDFDFEA